MISSALLAILQTAIGGILFLFRQLGEIPADSDIVASIAQFSSYLTPVQSILPLDTILLILGFEVIFESSYLAYKFIRWGYSKIPFVN